MVRSIHFAYLESRLIYVIILWGSGGGGGRKGEGRKGLLGKKNITFKNRYGFGYENKK